jgi:hypothetical protein
LHLLLEFRNYLTGQEFKNRVEAIVEAFIAMREGLEQEKRTMTRTWSKREKEIERVLHNTTGMYGDIQGFIGRSLPQIKLLEIESEVEDDNIVLD